MFFSSASPKLRNRTPPTCLKRGKRRAWQCKKNSRIPEQSICSLYQSFNCHLWSFAVTSPWAFRFLHCCSFTQIHVISSVHTSCILLWSIYQYISYDIVIISANYQVCLHQSYIRYNMTYSPYIYIYMSYEKKSIYYGIVIWSASPSNPFLRSPPTRWRPTERSRGALPRGYTVSMRRSRHLQCDQAGGQCDQ